MHGLGEGGSVFGAGLIRLQAAKGVLYLLYCYTVVLQILSFRLCLAFPIRCVIKALVQIREDFTDPSSVDMSYTMCVFCCLEKRSAPRRGKLDYVLGGPTFEH